LLVVESANDPPVAKSKIPRSSENTVLIYPIKISDLGLNGQSYEIFTETEEERVKWIEKILKTKKDYSASVYALNAEPFRLRVVEGFYFGYSTNLKLPMFSEGTALDRAIENYEKTLTRLPRQLSATHARVNCAVSFLLDERQLTIIGADDGIYVRLEEKSRQWIRCLDLSNIRQIDVLVEFDLLIVLSKGTLIYYNLDQVILPAVNQIPGQIKGQTRSLVSGYSLSRPNEVLYFTTGYHTTGPNEKRHILFYGRSPDLLRKNHLIEVLEPIKEQGLQVQRSMLKTTSISQSSTEYFNHIDTIDFQNETTTGITLFSSTFCVHTSKGFELMLLSYQNRKLIPDTSSISIMFQRSATLMNSRNVAGMTPGVATEALKRRLDSPTPIKTFMISDNQILLCYERFAIFCDRFANMASPLVVNFLCKIKNAVVVYPNLVTFSPELVEVRRLDKECLLKQVITGKDIRLVEDWDKQIMMAMAHPKHPDRQLILELVNNEFDYDDDNSSLAGL
jgi:hypothetical protein